MFVHAQIHAMEFTGTTAALNLLDHLLHSDDARVRHAVDTRTFYVVPRVNPDGAEAGLADGRFRRSSVRPYPRDEPRTGSIARTSTVTAASSSCACPTRTARGSRIPTTHGS